jgi:hypothetical protein
LFVTTEANIGVGLLELLEMECGRVRARWLIGLFR